jgi:starch-binding outer membrane protein, SusD/RagB family
MKNNSLIYVISLAIILMSSCNDDFLNLKNESKLSSESFWKTKEQVYQAMVANYAGLQAYNGNKWTFFEEVWTGMNYRGDDIDINTSEPYGREVANFTVKTDNSNALDMWRTWYSIIGRSNQIIANVPNVSDSEVSPTEKNAYIAEARFLRALSYMYLVVYFENVPLITTFETDETKLYPAQASSNEVWDFIEADFQFAESHLPESYNAANAGRATKWAAKSFLGKVYLAREKWTLARDKFAEVVNSGVFGLVSDFNQVFDGTQENGIESVFEIQFSANRTDGNDERTPLNYEALPYELGGWELYYPSQWIVDVLKNDKKADGTYSDRTYGTIFFDDPNSTAYSLEHGDWVTYQEFKDLGGSGFYHKKFSYAVDRQYYIGTNVHLMRYAEVLLMYAEALNEMDQTPQAITQINIVRARSKAAPLASMDKNALRNQIRHHERPAELAAEMGIRWFDLYRWNKGNTAKESIKATLTAHAKPFVSNYVEPKHDLLPIPAYEMNTNPNLVQNTGY